MSRIIHCSLVQSSLSVALTRGLYTLPRGTATTTNNIASSILSSKKNRNTNDTTTTSQSLPLLSLITPTFLFPLSQSGVSSSRACNFHTTANIQKYQQHHDDIQITGVSDDVASIIKQYAHKPQTSASLQTLMKTGRGEYLHKTYGSDHQEDAGEGGGDGDAKVATDKILKQVRNVYIHTYIFHNVISMSL